MHCSNEKYCKATIGQPRTRFSLPGRHRQFLVRSSARGPGPPLRRRRSPITDPVGGAVPSDDSAVPGPPRAYTASVICEPSRLCICRRRCFRCCSFAANAARRIAVNSTAEFTSRRPRSSLYFLVCNDHRSVTDILLKPYPILYTCYHFGW